jgi:hypothetical protein
MNAKTVAYWTITILLAFFIGSGGVAYVLQAEFTVEGFVILGLPVYMMVLIGVWKVAGAVVILLPGLPRIKEWAYAGILIDVTGAIVAHWAVGDFGAGAYHIVVNLVFAVMVVVSWGLRPPQRVLGTLATL